MQFIKIMNFLCLFFFTALLNFSVNAFSKSFPELESPFKKNNHSTKYTIKIAWDIEKGTLADLLLIYSNPSEILLSLIIKS